MGWRNGLEECEGNWHYSRYEEKFNTDLIRSKESGEIAKMRSSFLYKGNHDLFLSVFAEKGGELKVSVDGAKEQKISFEPSNEWQVISLRFFADRGTRDVFITNIAGSDIGIDYVFLIPA